MQERGIITPENLNTVVVVGFILALLSLVLAIFNAYKLNDMYNVTGDWVEHFQLSAAESQKEVQALRTRIGVLENELAETKKLAAQPIVVNVPETEAAAQ